MKKIEARKHFLAKRKQISQEKIRELSQNITALFFQSFDLKNIEIVHIFLPLEKQHEIDTFQIINHLYENFSQIEILIPKANPQDFSMEHYRWYPEIVLEKNQWDIWEPIDDFPSVPIVNRKSQIVNRKSSIIFLPLLAFDQQGYRVGYGKGFYDRFLAQCPPDALKIGLSMFEPIESLEDVDEFDIKMDFCITPKRVWRL